MTHLDNKIEFLIETGNQWKRTANMLFIGCLILFVIFIYGIVTAGFDMKHMIYILIIMAALMVGGVEFSLRARINSIYADLLTTIREESEIKNFLSLDDLPK